MSARTHPEILPAGVDQSRVPSLYRRLAPIYDVWAVLTERKARKRCLDRAQVRDGEDVLEVAVGTGLVFATCSGAMPAAARSAWTHRRHVGRARRRLLAFLGSVGSWPWVTPMP
jgi:hypothetical protein